MLKRVFTVVFSLLILVQSMRGTMVYVSLKMNQDEIAAKYCTSDNIPMCYGNCYIEKQLKSLEKETDKRSSSSNTTEKIFFWFISTPVESLQLEAPFWKLLSFTKSIYSVPPFFSHYLAGIFQPPRSAMF